jgi:hypothetical protein
MSYQTQSIFDVLNGLDQESAKAKVLEMQAQRGKIENNNLPLANAMNLSNAGQTNEYQRLQNERYGRINKLIDDNPVLGISSLLPAGGGGQWVLSDTLVKSKDPNLQEVGKQIQRQLIADVNRDESTAARNYNLVDTSGIRADTTEQKNQVGAQLNTMGYSAPQITEIFKRGDAAKIVNGKIMPATYFNIQDLQAGETNTPENTVAADQQGNQLQGTLEKSARTSTQINRAQFGKLMESDISAMESLLPTVAQYTGVEGKAKLANDALMSSLGQSSPSYTAYSAYMKNLLPSYIAKYTKFTGQSIDERAQQRFIKEVEPHITDTPELFQKRVGLLFKTLEVELDQQQQNASEGTQGEATAIDANEIINSVLDTYQQNAEGSDSANGTMQVIAPDGKTVGTIKSSDWAMAEKKGYRRVG